MCAGFASLQLTPILISHLLKVRFCVQISPSLVLTENIMHWGKSVSTPRLSAACTIQVRVQNNRCAFGQPLLIPVSFRYNLRRSPCMRKGDQQRFPSLNSSRLHALATKRDQRSGTPRRKATQTRSGDEVRGRSFSSQQPYLHLGDISVPKKQM